MSMYPKVFIKKYQLDAYYHYVVIKIFHDQCWKGYGAINYRAARRVRLQLMDDLVYYHTSVTCNQNKDISWPQIWKPIAQKIKSGKWK